MQEVRDVLTPLRGSGGTNPKPTSYDVGYHLAPLRGWRCAEANPTGDVLFLFDFFEQVFGFFCGGRIGVFGDEVVQTVAGGFVELVVDVDLRVPKQLVGLVGGSRFRGG